MNTRHGQDSQVANKRTPFNRNQPEISFDTPFATLTTAHWDEMRAQAEQCLDRFVSAAEQRQASKVLMIGLEMLEVAQRMLLEAYTMRADLPLRELADVSPNTRILR